MYIRFSSAVVLVVLVSALGVALEKRNLDLRRSLSRQTYQLDVLTTKLARQRVRTQQLGAPARLIDALESGRLKLKPPEKPAESDAPEMPLLFWQRAPLVPTR